MTDDFVAARTHALDDLRSMRAHEAAQVMCGRKLQFIEQIKQPPDPDAVSIVAPGVIALGLTAATAERWIRADARAEREVFDVGADIKREAFAVRPVVNRAAIDHRKFVTRVAGQHRSIRAIVSRSWRRIP